MESEPIDLKSGVMNSPIQPAQIAEFHVYYFGFGMCIARQFHWISFWSFSSDFITN